MNVSKLLNKLLPSSEVVNTILGKIKDKYNIPEVLPENAQLAETLLAERTPDEWRTILEDLENELRVELQLLPPDLEISLQGLTEMAKRSADLKGFDGMTVDINNPAFAFFTGLLMENGTKAFQFLDKIYKFTAQKLLDNLITGRPIMLPDIAMNPVGAFRITDIEGTESFVFAVAHQLTDPDEIVVKFRSKIVETFGEKPKIKEQHLELAEYLAMKNTKKSYKDLLELYLERNPDANPYKKGTSNYREKNRKLINDMKMNLSRLRQAQSFLVHASQFACYCHADKG
jgi:hypothetical protein